MPKILWKNILDSSRRELVLAIVMIPLFWLGITEGSFGGLNPGNVYIQFDDQHFFHFQQS